MNALPMAQEAIKALSAAAEAVAAVDATKAVAIGIAHVDTYPKRSLI